MDCVFCRIGNGEIPSFKIWEDKDFLAFLDINPITPGHTLIVPKKHVDYVFDLEDALYNKIFNKARELSKAIKSATDAEKIGIAVEGIAVRHVHLHLVPVNEGNDLDPCKAKKADFKDLEKMASLIKENL